MSKPVFPLGHIAFVTFSNYFILNNNNVSNNIAGQILIIGLSMPLNTLFLIKTAGKIRSNSIEYLESNQGANTSSKITKDKKPQNLKPPSYVRLYLQLSTILCVHQSSVLWPLMLQMIVVFSFLECYQISIFFFVAGDDNTF